LNHGDQPKNTAPFSKCVPGGHGRDGEAVVIVFGRVAADTRYRVAVSAGHTPIIYPNCSKKPGKEQVHVHTRFRPRHTLAGGFRWSTKRGIRRVI